MVCFDSADISWFHILRVIYAGIDISHESPSAPQDPSSRANVLTAEALLEQTFSQHRPLTLIQAIESLENVAVSQLLSVCKGSYRERCDMELYIEYDGIPAVSQADLRLILLLSRCVSVRGASSERAGEFLRISDDDVESLTCGRAFLTVTICEACIHFIDSEKMRGEIDSGKGTYGAIVTQEKASEDMMTHVYHSIAVVLGISREGSSRPFTESSSSMSVSSSSSSAGSWLSAARATTIIQFFELLVKHHYSVVHISVEGILDILSSCSENKSLRRNYDDFQSFPQSNCTLDILSSIMCAVFEYVPECRTSTVHLLFSSVMAFSAKRSDMTTSKQSHSKTSPDVQQNSYNFWAMTQLANSLCLHYAVEMSALTQVIESYIPALSLLPPLEMEKVLLPVMRVCKYSHSLLNVLMTLYRKSLLHMEPEKKIVAIRSFVNLIPFVEPQTQLEISQIVLYVFSTPICYQIAFQENLSLLLNNAFSNNALVMDIKSARSLLDTMISHLDKFFMAPSGPGEIAHEEDETGSITPDDASRSIHSETGPSRGLSSIHRERYFRFDPTSAIEKTGAGASATYRVRVNVRSLMFSVYSLEKYISFFSSTDIVYKLKSHLGRLCDNIYSHVNSNPETTRESIDTEGKYFY